MIHAVPILLQPIPSITFNKKSNGSTWRGVLAFKSNCIWHFWLAFCRSLVWFWSLFVPLIIICFVQKQISFVPLTSIFFVQKQISKSHNSSLLLLFHIPSTYSLFTHICFVDMDLYSSQLLKWIKSFCQDTSNTGMYFSKIWV